MTKFPFIPEIFRKLMNIDNEEFIKIKIICPHCGKEVMARINADDVRETIERKKQ